MQCKGCGFDAPPDFRFCPKCGRELKLDCPKCGFVCAPDFAFCPKCGAKLAAAPPVLPDAPKHAADSKPKTPGWAVDAEADRRPVTALFADLCGFTSLCERLDPEDVITLQRNLFAELTAAVESQGGYVDKVMGDGLLALFGAPVAHEDDAERALNCALAMCARALELGIKSSNLTEPLALHVGINTGPVAAGALGVTHSGGYSVTGDTVNSASRLQGLAKPGQVLVGPATYRLTRHAFAFEPLGALALRGRAAALDAYCLLGPLDTPRPSRGLETLGLTAPLVGRSQELGRIQAAFDRMLAGQTQVVRLVGEAGIGKTRLVGAFLESLREQGRLDGVTLRRAAASSLDARSYGVMAAILRDGYGILPDEPPASARNRLVSGMRELGLPDEDIARITPAVARVLGIADEDGAPGPSDPEQVRRQIVLAVRTMMEHRLAREPVLLVIEDLHWADAASVELLRLLADRLCDRQLMLVLTHRPDFDAAAIVTTKAAQSAVRLLPLSRLETTSLFEGLFGSSGLRLPDQLRELVVGRAGGNPFYLEEVVRGLVEDGTLVRDDTGWRASKGSDAVAIPLTLQGLLLARLDRLNKETHNLLREAAVVGPIVETGVLARVSATPNSIESTLEVLSDEEFLEELPRAADGTGVRRFRFRHALVREIVYENMTLRRRIALHHAVGDALEKLTAGAPRRPEDLVALGRHFGLGGDHARGATFFIEAGDWARNIYANEDALGHYRSALELLISAQDEEKVLVVRERIGDLLGRSGDRTDALDQYETVHAAYAAGGDRPAQARISRKIAALLWDAGERDAALERCRTGLALLENEPPHLEVAHHYEELGRLAFRSGGFAEAARWAERALAYVGQLGGENLQRNGGAAEPEWRREAAQIVSHAHNTLGIALARQGRAAAAVTSVERSVSVAENTGLADAALRGYSNLGVLYSTLNPQRAVEVCRKGLEEARRIGDLGFEARLSANLAVACCTFTDRCSAEGLEAAERALDLDRRLDLRDHLAVPLTVLAQIHQCHGSPEEALRYYGEALEIASEMGEAQLLFPCYDGLAVLYLSRDEQTKAEEYFQKAQALCKGAGIDPDAFVVLPYLA
jgi:adenylate cyclase